MMVLHPAKPLFDWDALEDSPSLQTLNPDISPEIRKK
jgi:hypothetical protein